MPISKHDAIGLLFRRARRRVDFPFSGDPPMGLAEQAVVVAASPRPLYRSRPHRKPASSRPVVVGRTQRGHVSCAMFSLSRSPPRARSGVRTANCKEVTMRFFPGRILFRRVLLVLGLVALSSAVARAQDWPQWALDPQHTG